MLVLSVKPAYTRKQLKSDNVQDAQANNGTNLLGVSRTLLRIVAQLPKSRYSENKSNGHNRRQVEERELNDLPDPASDEATSQG